MKWFKHETNANLDAKLKRVRMKYGMKGYGLYWYCLELIGSTVEPHNLTFELEHDAEIIANDTGINYELVQEMMTYMIDLGLFESSVFNEKIIITCIKMRIRADEYTQKLLKKSANLLSVPTTSRQTPDKDRSIRKKEEREEKERLAAQAAELVAYLNTKASKNFQPVDSNLNLVISRLKEGHSADDVRWVIDSKVSEWKNTDSKIYLRPATLFNALKFNQYIGEKTNRSSYGEHGI